MVLSRELAALYVTGQGPTGQAAAGQRARDRVGALTSREREVLSLLAGGMTTAEAAAALRISPTTVKSHVSHALPKLGVRNRMEAVLLAQRMLAAPE
ncbi:LuxR family transcriptional regulator [Micromonospora fluostatini]|uniref:LuxR family transcriptional regulator n=2 Tax=Micromonospora TaxID=1873 RepID=A0ABY2DF37_9ACTN|nr:LuxR family transcriptional regulator [Micromonospora fluostatini]